MTAPASSSNSAPLSPSALDELVRLALGLPEPGARYEGDAESLAVRAGLHLDSYTASENTRLQEIIRERAQERERQRSEERARSQARTRTQRDTH